MNRLPRLGERVRYTPGSESHRKEPCTGTVLKIWKNYEWDAENEREGPLLPIAEWQVTMKVDQPLPSWWAYGPETTRFCPEVKDLATLEKVNQS